MHQLQDQHSLSVHAAHCLLLLRRHTSLWNGSMLLYVGKGAKLTRHGECVADLFVDLV